MSVSFPPIGDLVPHAGAMRLVDEVIACDDDHIRVAVTVREDCPFFVPGRGVPGYLGFEFMAQAISANDGVMRRTSGGVPQLGFLLGARKYLCDVDWFAPGERLEIIARPVLNEGELRSFECAIAGRGKAELASATVNVYRPENPAGFLADA